MLTRTLSQGSICFKKIKTVIRDYMFIKTLKTIVEGFFKNVKPANTSPNIRWRQGYFYE
jgi:hypothetical protein